MIETREKTIGDATYSVTQLPARRALRLKAKLMKLFGPVFAQLFLITEDKASEERQKENLVNSVELLTGQLEAVQLDTLIVEILQGVRKNGQELTAPTIDIEFAGDIAGLYEVVFFVIEVNFANFFSMIGIGNLFTEQMTIPAQTTKRTFTKNCDRNMPYGV